LQTNNCGTSVAAGGSCTITVTFKPTAIGELSAWVSVADNVAGSPQTVSLSGVGKAGPPVVSLSTLGPLTFAGTVVGTVDPTTQAITLKNAGTATLSKLAISITGANASSFSQSNTCGTSVAGGAGCKITLTFKPALSGPLTANVSIADNAAGSPQTVSLAGTGTEPAVSLSPASLSFPTTKKGTTAATKAITLKNTGTGLLALSGTGFGISVAGTDASSFTQKNTCGSALAVNAECTITVSFKPAATGSLSASVKLIDRAAHSPQSVKLSGTGD